MAKAEEQNGCPDNVQHVSKSSQLFFILGRMQINDDHTNHKWYITPWASHNRKVTLRKALKKGISALHGPHLKRFNLSFKYKFLLLSLQFVFLLFFITAGNILVTK